MEGGGGDTEGEEVESFSYRKRQEQIKDQAEKVETEVNFESHHPVAFIF